MYIYHPIEPCHTQNQGVNGNLLLHRTEVLRHFIRGPTCRPPKPPGWQFLSQLNTNCGL